MLEIYRTVTENPGGVTRVTDSTDSIERDKDELSLMSEVGQRSGVHRSRLSGWVTVLEKEPPCSVIPFSGVGE